MGNFSNMNAILLYNFEQLAQDLSGKKLLSYFLPDSYVCADCSALLFFVYLLLGSKTFFHKATY